MNGLGKKIVDCVISWAVPVACAGLIALWGRLPEDMRHYWPVAAEGLMCVWSIAIALQNRHEIRKIHKIHENAEAKEAARQAVDESVAKAFRAMLDDDMGNLYAACVAKGYTTEDERRRYERLDAAYEGVHGNGEAKRRKPRFFALPDEEEWNARQNRQEREE